MNTYLFEPGHTVCKFSGKSPLSCHKMTLKQQINGQKQWKMKEKDLSCFGWVFTACLVLGRLNNVCLFLCTLINLYVYCTVLLNAKCALNGDMACLLSVNGPAWFPIRIHLSVITILSIYFYSVKLLLMFTFWSMLCFLVANFYADILYLFIARAVVFLRGSRKGWGSICS